MAKGDVNYLKPNNIQVEVEDINGKKQRALNTIVSNNVEVTVQSSTNPLFQYFLMNEIKTDITLTSEVLANDDIINVSPGHGFTGSADEYMVVRSGDLFVQTNVVSVDVNAITVEMPVDIPFPDTASVIRGNINQKVNGASAEVEFKYTTDKDGGVSALIPIDLKSVVITMQHAAPADDSLFGGISAIANGYYFRKINGEIANFGNYRNNQKFKDMGGVVRYTDKAGSGNHATDITFDLFNIFGQEVRLDPRTVDEMLGLVRDNLSTLLKYTVSLIGSFTSGE